MTGVQTCALPICSTKSIPPCGAGKGGCYFLNDQKVTKESLGPLPVSTLPAAVLTVIAPRPLATGDALLRIWHLRPAAPNTRPCVFLASGTQAPSSSQSPLYSGRPSVGIRHAAPLRLLSPPNPLRWALAGTLIKYLRCTDTAWLDITVAAGLPDHRRTKQIGRAHV